MYKTRYEKLHTKTAISYNIKIDDFIPGYKINGHSQPFSRKTNGNFFDAFAFRYPTIMPGKAALAETRIVSVELDNNNHSRFIEHQCCQ